MPYFFFPLNASIIYLFIYFYSHPVSIHPNDPVSPGAELLLLVGTSAQWRRAAPCALSIYGVSPFVVSRLPTVQ